MRQLIQKWQSQIVKAKYYKLPASKTASKKVQETLKQKTPTLCDAKLITFLTKPINPRRNVRI